MATQQTEVLVSLVDSVFQEYSQLVDSLSECEVSIASRKVDDFCINSMRSILGTYYLLKS